MKLSWPLPVLVIAVVSHLDVVLAQDNTAQCVEVTAINFGEPCPCNDVSFAFSLEGAASAEDTVVNIALVLDGSTGVGSDNFVIEKEFAKNVTGSFAESNLFINGGTSSYVQFGGSVDPSNARTFDSVEGFNEFVDSDTYLSEARDICTGIVAAEGLLDAAPTASAAFMFVVIYGDQELYASVADCASSARDKGITLMAIGVGTAVSDYTLSDIAGSDEYIFRADEDELESLVDDLLEASGVSCPASNVELAVTYGATVISTTFPDASIDGTLVTFNVDILHSNPTRFDVLLNSCGMSGASFHLVQNIEYNDDEGNSPDFTTLLDTTQDVCPVVPPSWTPTHTASTKASL